MTSSSCKQSPATSSPPSLTPKTPDQTFSKRTFSVRLLIIGLLALGYFTTSMSGSIMTSTILAMAPQRGCVQNDCLHHQQHTSRSPTEDVTTTRTQDHPNPTTSNKTRNTSQPEFLWSEQKQNWLIVSYNFGYFAGLLPAGAIVENFSQGGKWMALAGGLGHVFVNALSPAAARTSYWAFFGLRIILGVLQAALVPSFYYCISKWVPDEEKSKTIAMLGVGSSLGNIVLNLISGYICEHIGWSVVFYLVASFNALWLLLWWFLSSSRPAEHRFISAAELQFITSRTTSTLSTSGSNSASNHDQAQPSVLHPPSLLTWVQMLTSCAVRGIIIASVSHTWFYGVLNVKLPAYMLGVLGMDLQEISYFNMVIQSVLLVSVLVNGVLADWITSARKKEGGRGKVCNKTTQRKVFESVATFGTAFFTVLLPFTGENRWAFIVLLSGALACIGSTTGGSDVIIFDFTTRHTSILIALISSICTIVSLFVPSLVTLVLDAETPAILGGTLAPLRRNSTLTGQSLQHAHLNAQWNVVFFVTAAVHCTGGLVFALTADTKRQKWS